ncbi:hypothetical protein [Eoetvoesiella caeni]|uniref:hypothetical protein n=1 Tax=Eoetvoesiella caeni TaxID=645616 RepID=UPI0011BE0858|nr:hypothetical protein [Eoetvoesiella caeni]MCI2809329.1 hypothetical protein [Eoetvoesiella caeni]NYT54469.1 hypothetical protein [Eoetvoesiella caeni]
MALYPDRPAAKASPIVHPDTLASIILINIIKNDVSTDNPVMPILGPSLSGWLVLASIAAGAAAPSPYLFGISP